jgi:23S rRNA (adenine2503-C2)-methyltransferase
MDLALLEQTLRERGEPAFRARQVWEWTAHGAPGYSEMTNLPRTLRADLEAAVPSRRCPSKPSASRVTAR